MERQQPVKNLSLEKDLPLDNHWETDVQVSDPAEALKQAIEYCYAVKEYDPNRSMDGCDSNTRIVVLAQMPQETATSLVRSFRSVDLKDKNIDLVITEADPDRGTGFRTTKRTNQGGKEFRDEFDDPLIVVPSPGASSDPPNTQNTFVTLQRALVTPGDFSKANAPRIVTNEPIRSDSSVLTDWFPGFAAGMKNQESGKKLLDYLQAQKWKDVRATDVQATKGTSLQAAGLFGTDQWKQGLREVALKRMELYCHSDAAMIQLRDIFFITPFADWQLTKNGYAALMDAIFWKGDYMQCVNINGGTITSVLQRSSELQQRQYYGLLSDLSLSLDWSVDALGANADQQNATRRLVEDKLIDPKKLYSVAVTDFLRNGDTGYTDFQGAEPLPDQPWSKTTLLSLSEGITTNDATPTSADKELDSMIRVPVLPQSQQHKPDKVTSDWGNAFASAFLNRADDYKLGTRPLETIFQRRPLWSFELYKMDLSYSVAAHSGLERTVPQTFPGVSAVDLTAQDSSSIAMDYLARAQYDWGNFSEFYVQSELNYGYKKSRQAAKLPLGTTCYPSLPIPTPAQPSACDDGDPYSKNQTADFWYTETGYAIRIGSLKNPYGWKIQLPAAVQTQLEPSIALPEGLTGQMNNLTPIPTPKTVYLEGRPGIRLDFSFPKPANWNIGQAGGAGSQGGGSQQASGGGKGGKGGGGASASNSSGGQNGQNGSSTGSGGGGGGGSQAQTFDSFIEAGLEFGPSVLGPKAYVFNDPNSWMTSSVNYFNEFPQTTCNAITSGGKTTVPVADIVNCFLAANYPVPAAPAGQTTGPFAQPFFSSIDRGRFHWQQGLYTNYHLDIPLAVPENKYTVFSNIEFVLDLRSDFFFGGSNDTPVDTHFLVDAKQAINIPIFTLFSGKVSLAPTVELIYYTNKINNNLYRSYSGSVALSYTFDWRRGLSFPKVIGYSNPVPTLPSLPSR